jgi:hypothetical protein
MEKEYTDFKSGSGMAKLKLPPYKDPGKTTLFCKENTKTLKETLRICHSKVISSGPISRRSNKYNSVRETVKVIKKVKNQRRRMRDQ